MAAFSGSQSTVKWSRTKQKVYNMSDWPSENDGTLRNHKMRSEMVHAIIHNLSLEHLRTIVGSGWDVNETLGIPGHDKYTLRMCCEQRAALHEATRRGWIAGVKTLLDAGAKIDTSDGLENPLILALQNQHCKPNLIELLLKHGADPNYHKTDSLDMPLLQAVLKCMNNSNYQKIVQLLLEHGANKNVPGNLNINVNGEYRNIKWTPTTIAAWLGLTNVVKILLNTGTKSNSSDELEKVLTIALQNDKCPPDLIEILLKHGADPNHRETDEDIPLLQAITKCKNKSGFSKIVELLLEHGADPDVACKLKVGTGRADTSLALLHRERKPVPSAFGRIKFWLFKSSSSSSSADTSALGYAARLHGQSDLVRLLIRHGADTSRTNITLLKEHFYPWHFSETPLVLLQAGMRVSREAKKQLSNMEVAISAQLQIKPIWAKIEKTERLKQSCKKSFCPEYWSHHMADLQEFSDESLQVYPMDERRQTDQEPEVLIRAVLGFLSQTQSLQWYCRRCVRENLVSLQPSAVTSLPIPARLKRYILCHEI